MSQEDHRLEVLHGSTRPFYFHAYDERRGLISHTCPDFIRSIGCLTPIESFTRRVAHGTMRTLLFQRFGCDIGISQKLTTTNTQTYTIMFFEGPQQAVIMGRTVLSHHFIDIITNPQLGPEDFEDPHFAMMFENPQALERVERARPGPFVHKRRSPQWDLGYKNIDDQRVHWEGNNRKDIDPNSFSFS